MEQPLGKVEGTLTLYRADGVGGMEWWQVSRHTMKSRTKFWVRCFRGTVDHMVMTGEQQTDDLWGQEASDTWIDTQTRNRLRSGFRPNALEGQPGPKPLTDLLKQQLQLGPKDQK